MCIFHRCRVFVCCLFVVSLCVASLQEVIADDAFQCVWTNEPIEIDGVITFSWTAPSNGGTPITGISLERGATEGATAATQAVTLGVTSFTVTGIPLGVSYWRVVYTNAIGEGPESDDIMVDPTAPSGGFGSSTFGTAPFGG